MAILLGHATAVAQETDGTNWQEKAGLVLVKPQAWSADDLAAVVEFQAFTDRTVRGRQAAGYFIFRNGTSSDLQVPAARIVKMVIFPEPVRELVRAEQRAALQKRIDEYTALGAKFPAAGRPLEKFLTALRADAAKFDGGNVKDESGWVPKSVFYKKKADALAGLAVMDIKSAPKVRSLNLSLNQYFAGLEDLVGIEPSVKAQVDSVRALYERLRRKEERNELMEKLKSPNATFDNSLLYVATLKTLQPAEDPAVSRFLDLWDRSVKKAAKLSAQVAEVRTALEEEMAPKAAPPKAAVISADLVAGIQQAAEDLADFRKGNPPPVIEVPAPMVKALVACSAGLPDIRKEMDARRYYEAKFMLAEISGAASLVGPNTAAAADVFQQKATTEIRKFEALRGEGKALQDTGKKNEAVMKYREAWATMPDKDVAARIESLKN